MSYEELLTELALSDERFIVMTAENRALIRKLPQLLGNRFIDTGITEQTMVGAAAGLALRGRTPVVHALASFLSMRAFEFAGKIECFYTWSIIGCQWPYPPGNRGYFYHAWHP
jgi:transketolase